MNKTDLVKEVSKNLEITQKDACRTIDEMTRVIMEKLISGEDVSLKGFGSFKIKERKARKGRNPKTGKEIKIPKTKAVKFNPSKDMKESVKKKKKK